MTRLNFPEYNFRIIYEDNREKIWDEVRKKFVALTPEEWVRQNIIRFLTEEKGYPSSLIKVETGLKVNRLYKRTDVLVHSNNGTPLLLVECKASDVKITQEVFNQIAMYNIPLKVPYLLVSNGLNHYCCRLSYDREKYEFIQEVPDYHELT